MLTNEQIEQMSEDYRCQLAQDTDNIDILKYLSNDVSFNVRRVVAWNANTSIGILSKLSSDEYWYVCSMANERLKEIKYEQSLISIDKYTTRGILE